MPSSHWAVAPAIGESHTNTIEGAWSHFKLSIRAIYIGVSPKHLQKYCAEYEYRYNTRGLKDDERFDKWFGHVNVKNLRYMDLIGVGRLMLAPADIAPTPQTAGSEPISKKDRLEQRRLANPGKRRALPGDGELLSNSELL